MICYGVNIPDVPRVPRACFAWCVFLSFVLLAGCKSTRFELELRPDGDNLQRKVTTWVQDTKDDETVIVEYPAEELQHFAEIYGIAVPEDLVAKHVFEESFQGSMPNDLGGSGWYLHRETSMGSSYAYLERFGDDQIAPDLRSRELNAHRTIDVFVAWLDTEYSKNNDSAEFRSFVDTVVREDFWNIVLYSWGYDLFAAEIQPSDADIDEELVLTHLGIRVAAYLAEHGYFDPLQAVQYLRAGQVWDYTDDPKPVLELITRSIATKMGVAPGDPLPEPLVDLVLDWEQWLESFYEFANNSDEVRAMVEAWNLTEREPFDPESEKQSILEQLLDRAILPEFDIFGNVGDRLEVALHVPVEPVYTNGEWDGEGAVRWTEYVRGRRGVGENLPDILHAIWSEPATEFQTKHFGHVVLDSEALAEYVFWHTSLPVEMAEPWDRFLASLQPGHELVMELRQYCIKGHEELCEVTEEDGLSPHPVFENVISSLQP
jgi:hypothetical protein